jgi:pimeloyl-ACP methyl ester carboxylesterase
VFDGFEVFDIATTATTIHGRRGGEGPPVLLLHGIPETHVMWHRVALQLAEHFTVIATDLRGFGDGRALPPGRAPDQTARRLVEFLTSAAITHRQDTDELPGAGTSHCC